MFVLDLLDSLPRLWLSDHHLNMIIWAMQQCGTPDVPTFSQLRAMQKQLKVKIGVETTHHRSSQGNKFYANSASSTFQLVSDTGLFAYNG